MSRHDKLGISWPPCGWDGLGFIKTLNAQAVAKDPMMATIVGLSYEIEPIPVYLKNHKKNYIYHLKIEGWKYSIQNESRGYSVLSFNFQERLNKFLPKNKFISDIRTKSRPFILNERSAQRAYMAAIFMIKQIESGQVPDYKRILRLYKIHPSQRSLYEIDYVREDSRNCGIMPFFSDGNNDSEKI